MSKESDERRARFAAEYVKDLNGTQAAVRAGFAEAGAHVTASRLLKEPKVQEAIAAARGKRDAVAAVSGAQVIDELALIAMSDIGNVMASSPCGRYLTVRSLDDLTPAARRAIKSIKQTTHESRSEGGGIVEKVVLQVELHPKVAALELLMGHFGLKAPEKLDVVVEMTSAKDTLGTKLDELRKRRQGAESS